TSRRSRPSPAQSPQHGLRPANRAVDGTRKDHLGGNRVGTDSRSIALISRSIALISRESLRNLRSQTLAPPDPALPPDPASLSPERHSMNSSSEVCPYGTNVTHTSVQRGEPGAGAQIRP